MSEERATVTAAEAAKILKVHRMTITRMVKTGELEAYKDRPTKSNSRLRIYQDSIDRILELRGQAAASNS